MFNMNYNFPYETKKVKYFANDSYTGVFIRPRTVSKLRTLGQLRHRSVASLLCNPFRFLAVVLVFNTHIPKWLNQIYIVAHLWKEEILSFPVMCHSSRSVTCIKF